jgi:ribosomal protein S18 acetylase RimI-like enzyme
MDSSENVAASGRRISLRAACASDGEFLMRVYESTREGEMAAWGWNAAQRAIFVRMQYDARQRGYAAAYPMAVNSVILVGDDPVGSIIVFRGAGEIRLLDIALLPEFRGSGIGSELIGMLISEAARTKSPLRLSVLRGNRAAHLYEQLGFVAKGGDALYCEMEWAAAQGGISFDVQVSGE